MGTNDLKVKIFDSVEDAPRYDASVIALTLDKACVVKNGTINGNPTVDLVLYDKNGKEYLAMVTGGIIKMLSGVVEGAE